MYLRDSWELDFVSFFCSLLIFCIQSCRKLEHAKDTDEPKGSFYFSHSIEAMLFFTSMNIGKNTVPLTSRNYKDMANRNWRTSLLSPFATNFVAVFYRYSWIRTCDYSFIIPRGTIVETSRFRCESEDSPFKVAFYLAEHPVTLEGCENGVCDWAKLKETLSPVVENCDIKHCRSGSNWNIWQFYKIMM